MNQSNHSVGGFDQCESSASSEKFFVAAKCVSSANGKCVYFEAKEQTLSVKICCLHLKKQIKIKAIKVSKQDIKWEIRVRLRHV